MADHDGQIIESLHIVASSGAGIEVDGYSGIVIRNCLIEHAAGPGITFSSAANMHIENVDVVNTGAPASGANPSTDWNDIYGESSTGVVITHARVTRGSSGIYLQDSPGAQLSFIEGHDIRGPDPRGQLVQFNRCDDAVLEDFSVENGATSWPEDDVSIYQSSNVAVRRGLIDGDNSPSGDGVMFELSGGSSSGGLCEDVDAVHMGNGCFAGYPATNVTFRRTRCRDNICTDQGRGVPSSGGLAWAGSPSSSNLQILASSYHGLCSTLVWDMAAFSTVDLTDDDFTPRAPIRLHFCWE